jgi:copper chaperone
MELSMIVFNVNDMTCGHCVGAVTGAVKAVLPRATVSVHLGTKRVEIDASPAEAAALKAAIAQAGYTPVDSNTSAQSQPARSAGCCGGCH